MSDTTELMRRIEALEADNEALKQQLATVKAYDYDQFTFSRVPSLLIIDHGDNEHPVSYEGVQVYSKRDSKITMFIEADTMAKLEAENKRLLGEVINLERKNTELEQSINRAIRSEIEAIGAAQDAIADTTAIVLAAYAVIETEPPTFEAVNDLRRVLNETKGVQK